MGKSLIQVANPSNQAVTADSIITLGSVIRRYGCNCKLSGNAIELYKGGYYKVNGTVSISSTAAGNVTVGLYQDGVQYPGAIAYGTAAGAGDFVTLPIQTTVRIEDPCGSANLTLVVVEGAGSVVNVSLGVDKD